MLKKQMTCRRIRTSDQGFTMIEVLVAILLATSFVLIATQAIVIAAVLRVNARRISDASLWMQQELEQIQYKAYTLAADSDLTDTNLCYAQNATNGYAKSLLDQISTTTTSKPILGKTYYLRYNPNPPVIRNEAPFDVLQISLEVNSESNGTGVRLAEIHTEVIPNAAISCP